MASNNAWVGCSRVPSPALITAQLTFCDNKFAAPESWCRITRISGCIAFRVMAVSINVSPFLIEELATFIFITSAPNRFPASSKELKVLVEFSKNKLIWVLPFKIFSFLFSCLFSSTKAKDSSKIKLTSGIDKYWIPKRCL